MPTKRWLAPHAARLIPTGILLSGHGATRRMAIDSPATREAGDFGAMLLLTTEPDRFLKSWHRPEEEISLRSAVSVRRGAPIVAFVIFRGCQADASGLCQSSVDFRVLKPDGSEYLSFENRDLWRAKPAPPEGAVQVSAEHLGVVIEPADPLGPYEVQVVVRDEVANVSLKLSRTFDAVAP
jgi:hypothetical protein